MMVFVALVLALHACVLYARLCLEPAETTVAVLLTTMLFSSAFALGGVLAQVIQ